MGSSSIDKLLEMDLSATEDDWHPTPHGQLLAKTLATQDLVSDRSVLELGGGVGNHTILLVRKGAARVVTTEITESRSETTRRNVALNCERADDVEYRVADWLQTPGTFDVVVTNPPFAVSGKQNRRYFIDSLILDAHKRLVAGGSLIFIQSSMADLGKTMRRLDENGFDADVIATSRGPFRGYYFEDETFMAEIQDVPAGFEMVDGTHYETLSVIRATLRAFAPPQGAH